MSADLAHEFKGEQEAARPATLRARLVLALGPATSAAGLGWAVLQPWRLTLLHPHGQGIWWLLAEPPLYVMLVGVLFRVFLAPGIAEDVEAAG
ncbi:MAG: hypothetical protein ACYDCH_03460 [Gaiellaceae bacterium]